MKKENFNKASDKFNALKEKEKAIRDIERRIDNLMRTIERFDEFLKEKYVDAIRIFKMADDEDGNYQVHDGIHLYIDCTDDAILPEDIKDILNMKLKHLQEALEKAQEDFTECMEGK